MSKKDDLIEAHGKGMSGCETLEQWGARHLRKGNLEDYRGAFEEVKKRQAAADQEAKAAQEAIEKAMDQAKKNFAR